MLKQRVSLLGTCVLLLGLLITAGGLLFHANPAYADSTTVSINNTTPYTSVPFQGIGGMVYPTLAYYEGTERGMTPGDLQLFKARVKKLGVSLIRTWIFENYYQPLNSSTPTYTSTQLTEAYHLLDFYQANNITVLLNIEPNETPTSPSDVSTFATNATNFLAYLHNTKGYTCIKYVMLWNEPNLAGVSTSASEALYVAFKAALNAANMSSIAVTGPDVGINDTGYITDFAQHIASSLDDYSDHVYDAGPSQGGYDDVANIKNSDDPNGASKGLILSEFGNSYNSNSDRNVNYATQAIPPAAQVVYGLNAGWTGFARWTLYDNFYDDCCDANQTTTDLNSQDNNWGLWRGKNDGWQPRQSYYAYSLLTKFAQVGSTIYRATPSSGNLAVAALKAPDGTYTIFAINTGPNDITSSFSLSGAINQTLQKFLVTPQTPTDPFGTLVAPSGSFNNVGTSWSDTIPARSIVAYTADWNPDGVSVGGIGNLQVTDGKVPALSWSAATNATYYRVYRSTQSGFTPSSSTEIGETDTNSYVDESVPTSAQTYYYQVVAVGRYEQTGSASGQVTLNHASSFSNSLSWATTDDGQDYTITSDQGNGYTFKVALRSGVSKDWADSQGTNHITQTEAEYSVPRIESKDGSGNLTELFKMSDQASSVSAPTSQSNGHLQVVVTEGSSTLTYDFGPTSIHVGVSGNSSGYHVQDVSYLGISQAHWSDGSTTNILPTLNLQNITSPTTSSMQLVSAQSPYSVNYSFDSPAVVTLNQSGEEQDTQISPGFDLASGGGYTLSLQAGQVVPWQTPAGQNLAQNLFAFASSSSSGFDVSQINDGSTGSVWSSNLLDSSTSDEWAGIDLGAPLTFNRVVLTPRFDANGNALGFPTDFQIQGSNDAGNWTTLLSESSYANPTGNSVQTFTFASQSYRYVRILATNTRTDGVNYYVQVAEMQVYHDAQSGAGQNLAHGKTVTASSTPGWCGTCFVAGNLTDGNNGDFWSSQELSSSAANEWATVDLGSQSSFDRVVLYPREDSNGNAVAFPSAFQIRASNDGNTWTTLASESNFANPSGSTGVAFWVGAQSYRYVGILATTARTDGANYYVQLAEFEVYQDALSTGKSATASSTPSWCGTCFVAGNLTDNNNGSLWSSQELSSSSANEWAYVDLGSQSSFDRVVLYPRFDSNGNALAFPSAFQIQGSNDANSWTTLTSESNAANPTDNAGVACWVGAQSYRYVRVLATTATTDGANYYVQFAELEVENS